MMKAKFLVFLQFCFLSISCNQDTTLDYLSIEVEAINDVICDLIDIEYHYEPAMPLEMFLKDSFSVDVVKKKELEYSKKLEAFQNELKVLKKQLYLCDTLFPFDFSIKEPKIQYILQQDPFLKYSDYVTMAKEISISTITNCGEIDLLLPDFIIENGMYERFGVFNDTLKIGIMKISRVLFDERFETGILLYTLSSTGTKSKTSIVIIMNDPERNKWLIKDQIVFEVS